MADAKKDKLQIRNSTVDFLVFTKDAHEDGIEVRVQDHDVWLTQKAIARLFDVDRSVVTKHLKNVYESGELSEDATCANFAQVADNGKTYHYKFYSLSAIIAVGYRINSGRATQFRQWATKVLDTFTKQGYVLDKSRLINGQIFDEDYFDHLISEIQEIRASERRFYQKITDIYATAVDYSLDSQTTKDFFATVQNKMHYAVHGGTAAEVIMARADHTKEHMGLTSWKNAPDGKIVKADVSVAKNYLSMSASPSMPGIFKSVITASMCCVSTMCSASCPLLAVAASRNPFLPHSTADWKATLISGSSSTSNKLYIVLPQRMASFGIQRIHCVPMPGALSIVRPYSFP